MLNLACIALLLLYQRAYTVRAAPSGSQRPCIELELPVAVTAQNGVYDLPDVHNSIDAAAFVVDISEHTSPTPQERLTGNTTVTGTFNISAQLCIPSNGKKNKFLQIATHGLAFDKRYWDVPINPSEYSYVQNAIDAGYSILTYDRLGTGKSDKPDARKVVQAPLELEILRGITEMARDGKMMEYASQQRQSAHSSAISNPTKLKFEKIIHVGHSFGSFLTTALLTTYGNLSDGAIITGYILNKYFGALDWASFDLQYAAESDPKMFGDRTSNYLVGGSKSAIQVGFFSTRRNTTTGIGGFDPKLLDLGFSTRQSITTTEIVSPAQLNLGIAKDFKGPVQYVIAEFDYLVCNGDCRDTYDTKMIQGLYPNLKPEDFDFYVQPGTGHGLTMHRNASVGYKASLDWLNKRGL